MTFAISRYFNFSFYEKKEEIWLNPVTKTHTPTEQSKKQRDNIKTPPKTLITQLMRTDLGRSVGVTAVTQLVWLNQFTSAQPSLCTFYFFIYHLYNKRRHKYHLIQWMFDYVCLCCWLAVLRINVDLAIFQPYLDLEAGDNQSLKIQVARPGIEPRSSCSASQELNHSATAAPYVCLSYFTLHVVMIII